MLCTLLIVFTAGFTFAQSLKPEQTARSFYKWYVHELNAERNPTDEKAKLRQFVSVRLAKWVASTIARGEYDADYFLAAQDWGRDWGDNIQISNVAVNGSSATLRVKLIQPNTGPTAGMGNRILELKLLKEGGVWKIDRVKGKD